MKNQAFLPSLQVLRAFAAIAVLFRHLWPELSLLFGFHSAWGTCFFRQGLYGVVFFFVLSGFIICFANYEKGSQPAYAKEYLLNRVLRIYIPYLPLTLAFLIVLHVHPTVSLVSRDVSVVKSLFLLPVPGVTALSVAWTLIFEMMFYVIFIIYIINKRLFYVVCGVWLVAIILGAVFGSPPSTVFPFVLVDPHNLEFLSGVGLAIFVKQSYSVAIHRRLMIALALAAVGIWFAPSYLDDKLYFGILFSLVILVAIHTGLNKLSQRNVWMVLGNASYSIYLIHYPIISFIIRILPVGSNVIYIVSCFVLIGICCCVCGVVYSKIFEGYLMTKAKHGMAALFSFRKPVQSYPSV